MVAQTQYQDYELEYGTGGDFELPPPGTYKIVFKGVVAAKDFPATRKNKETGVEEKVYDEEGNEVMETSLTLQFAIDDEEDDYDGTEFRDYFPLKITAGNKSGRLWAAFLGITPEELVANPIPKTSNFVGRRCDASLTHRKAGNGKTYLKISAATPLKKKRAALPRPVVEEVPSEPDF